MTDINKDQDGREEKAVMSEQLTALFDGTELSEEFKTTVETLFETAVNQHIAEKTQELEEDYQIKLDEAIEAEKDKMSETLDGFLSHVVQEWLEMNELAVEQGIRTEVAESFIEGMREVFKEHYVEMPEEKRDLVAEMAQRVEELEEQLNTRTQQLIETRKENKNYQMAQVIAEASKGLADTEVEKLVSLVEGIEFVNNEDFAKRVNIIKEAHFGEAALDDDDAHRGTGEDPSLHEELEPVDPSLQEEEEQIDDTVDPEIAFIAEQLGALNRKY